MGKLKRYYINLNLQNKLRFSYILLILIPVTFLCVLYYGVASGSILDVAKKNILDVTVKNTEIMDSRMQIIQDNALRLNVENTVYTALDEMDQASESQLMVLDKKVEAVLQKFFFSDYVLSANIITPRYTFGNNSQVVIPNIAFYQSEVYKKVQQNKGGIVWLPTYHVEDAFQLDYPINQEKVFSMMHELHPVYLDAENPNDVRYMDKNPATVLVINFYRDMIRDIFDDSNSIQGAFFCLSSIDGIIVSHTDSDLEGMQNELPWLEQMDGQENGSMIMKYHGSHVVVCYAVSSVTGWVAVSVTPVSSLLNNVSKIQRLTIAMWIFLFLLAMMLATVFSRRITQPIGQLVDAMKRVGKGDFGLRLPTNGTDEMQYLTEKYNEMGERIETLVEENYKSEIRNKESEIMAINLQLNPHFLYNTMNIINMMALEDGNMEMSRMLLCLSDMLQYTFRNKKELVPFEEEYLWLQNYLYIMQVRFEGKFKVAYQIDAQLYQYNVPKLLLQPLVENAIVHGFREWNDGGILQITGTKTGGNIYLEVRDNGTGMTPEELDHALKNDDGRIGLSNAIRRLQLIYGDSGKLEVETRRGAGTCIKILIPAQS